MGAMAHTSGDNTRHLQKLATLVKQRRVALGFPSKEAAAEACRLSHSTYRHVEAGRPVSDTTYTKVEIAFKFRPGSCKAVLDGADSIVIDDGTELIEGGQIRDFANSEELEEEFDRAFDKSASLTAPHLTLSEARAMKEAMIQQLRDRGVLKSK